MGLFKTYSITKKYNPYGEPFYIEDVSGIDNTAYFQKSNGINLAPTITIEKSLDGITWDTIGTTSRTSITATIPANGKLYLRCKTDRWSNSEGFHNYFYTDGHFNVGGNIMSLLYGDTFTGAERSLKSYAFTNLFNTSYLISVEKLLLPATTLAEGCYYGMFFNSTSITVAPALPATTLANSCYKNMFGYCTSLTTAPALPATTLTTSCYETMFDTCTSLNNVHCLATNISATNCTKNWLNNVAATGTFTTPSSTSWTTDSTSGIPEGWTRVNA